MEDTVKKGFMEPLDISEEQIPWFRMRWFFALTLLFIYPVALIIGLSGNVYGKHKNTFFKVSDRYRYFMIVLGLGWTLSALLRFF